MAKRFPRINVEVDLVDHPEVCAAIERIAEEEAASEIAEYQRVNQLDYTEIAALKGHLEDARRMLTRAESSKSEALIYIERALVTANEL